MSIEKISNAERDALAVSSLATRPNSTSREGTSGLTPAQLKAKYDALPFKDTEKINEIIDLINGSGESSLAALLQTPVTYQDIQLSLLDLLDIIALGTLGNLIRHGNQTYEQTLTGIEAILAQFEAQIEGTATVTLLERLMTPVMHNGAPQTLLAVLTSMEDGTFGEYAKLNGMTLGEALADVTGDLDRMEVTAVARPYGSPATAELSGGHGVPFHLTLGLPQGEPGPATGVHEIGETQGDIALDSSLKIEDQTLRVVGMPFTTVIPTSDNETGTLIGVITDTVPRTRYEGYIYLIVETEEEDEEP